MKFNKIIGLLFFWFSLQTYAQSPDYWIEKALRHHPDFKVEESKLKAIEQSRESAFEWGATQLEFSTVEWMPNRLSPYFRPVVSLSQDIPWKGTKKVRLNRVDAEWQSQKAAQTELQSVKKQEINEQYIELQYLEEVAAVLEEYYAKLEALYQNLLIRLESGQTPAWEVLLMENECNEIKNKIHKNHYLFEQEQKNFSKIIGTEISELYLDPLDKEEIDEEIFVDGINNHPRLHQIESQKNLLEASQENMRLEYKPKLSIGIHYEAAMPVEPTYVTHDMIMPTVGLSFPLFTNKRKAKQRQIDLQIEGVGHEIEAEKQKLDQELISVRNLLYEYQSDWKTRQKNQQNTKDALELIEKEYEVGKVSYREIIRIYSDLIQLEEEQLRTLKSYHQAKTYLTYLINEEL